MKNIKLKGGLLFKICGVLVLCVTLTCCCYNLELVDEPATAIAGEEITVKLNFAITNTYSGDGSPTKLVNGIVGILAPKGWKLAENAELSYTSSKGNGRLKPLSPATLDPGNSGYNYSQSMMLRVGRLNNLINDMEWVPFITENTLSYNNSQSITGTITIKMKVAVDGNDTKTQLAYMLADNEHGVSSSSEFIDGDCVSRRYWMVATKGSCINVTGGTTGDLVNFCDPQYSYIDPPKVLDDDYVTINFDANAGNVPSGLLGAEKVYFCGKANLEGGGTVDFCADDKSVLKRQGSSNLYKLTVWPRAFFGLQDNQKIVSLEYFITDQAGESGTKVGLNNTQQPFIIKFKCN